MTEPIRIKIEGGAPETDAPTVDDLLDQVRDYVAILEGVEAAIGRAEPSLVWRVTGATKNSPLVMELTPFPKEFGTDISRRDREVREATARGLFALRATGERPIYFDDGVLEKAEQVFRRVTNGLSSSSLDVGEGVETVVITPVDARAGVTAAQQLRKPAEKPWTELGSLECRLRSLEVDGRGPKVMRVISRIDNQEVKVFLAGDALVAVERREVHELWDSGQRLRLYGSITYKAPGRIGTMIADAVEFVPHAADLPTTEDIIDPDFTGGLSSEEYLRRLRDGEVS
jgi:hypothetical protein